MHPVYKVALCCVLVIIAINVVVLVTNAMGFVHRHFLLRQRPLTARYGADSWAVITGGSSGQGREFALQLASDGALVVRMADGARPARRAAAPAPASTADGARNARKAAAPASAWRRSRPHSHWLPRRSCSGPRAGAARPTQLPVWSTSRC